VINEQASYSQSVLPTGCLADDVTVIVMFWMHCALCQIKVTLLL